MKNIIEQALASVPNDRHFYNVKFYLNKALTEVKEIEKKANKKAKNKQEQTVLDQWKDKLKAVNPNAMVPMNPANALGVIQDLMIKEQKKIEQRALERNKPNDLLID